MSTITMLQNNSLYFIAVLVHIMSHKTVTRKILTTTGNINGFAKEELHKMLLNIKTNPPNALVLTNDWKE